MTDKRLFLVLPALALLAACNDAPSEADEAEAEDEAPAEEPAPETED